MASVGESFRLILCTTADRKPQPDPMSIKFVRLGACHVDGDDLTDALGARWLLSVYQRTSIDVCRLLSTVGLRTMKVANVI